MSRTAILLLFLFALGAVAIRADPARAGLPETRSRPRQFTVAEGLPSNRINGLAEDRQGYLWIATSDGLARYDGIGFRIWRAEDGLRDNHLWSVHVDARDRVWIGTDAAGLVQFDADRRRFRHYDRGNTPGMAGSTVWAIASTRDGALWFGTAEGGLHRLSAQGTMTRFMPRAGDPRSLPDAAVTYLAVTPDDALWIGTRGGLARWTGRDFARVPRTLLDVQDINGLNAEADGTLWIGSPQGVAVRRPGGGYSGEPWRGHGDAVLNVLLRDRSGQYWLDIPEGLGRVDGDRIRNVPLYSNAANGIVKPSWTMAHEDRGGGLWFASIANGLWYLPGNWRQFSVLSRRADDALSMGNAHVRGIAASADGSMWLVGSGGALDRLDPETGAVAHVLQDAGGGTLPAAVFEDRNGQVWIGGNASLARLLPAAGAVRRWHAIDAGDALKGETIGFIQTRDGRLWIASASGGVQVRDAAGPVLDTVLPGQGRGLPAGVGIEQLGLGPDGAAWIAGTQGLSTWNAGTRRFEPVPGAPARRLYAFFVRARDEIWIADTGRLGRYRWDGRRLAPVLRMDVADGLPRVAPSGLTVDHAGIVWMTSVRGLVRIDPRRRAVRVYGVNDGLPSQQFGEAPVVRRGDGRILAGSPDGLVLFDPAVVRPVDARPSLVIESMQARRGDALVRFRPARRFALRHDDRDLRVVARLVSFNNAPSHRYRFRLAGFDRDWVEAGASGERVFSRLDAGDYRLQVKAASADNQWSPIKTIAFRVMPPWWRTPWALCAWVALACIGLWWMGRLYRDRLKRRHAWQLVEQRRALAEQASEAKSRFLATLGHEVRTPMTGVMGMGELLLATPLDPVQRGYVESIRSAGDHLLRLVNDALDLARIEAGRLELEQRPFDLHALVGEVAALMAPLARRRGLDFRVHIAQTAPRWLQGDAVRIRQILLNLLGNATKFTDAGHVSLDTSRLHPEGVRFVVGDSGPGLAPEQKSRLFRRFEQADGARTAARHGGSGLGLAISQELAAAMEGRIAVDSEPGQGTRFTVALPLREATPLAARIPAPHPPGIVAARGGLHLLLVEDDPTVAEVIVGLLQAQAHTVVHAPHGLAALGEVATHAFDLALLDLDLPGIDGLALARQLRAQGFSGPLIAVTARADADAEGLARAVGFDGFLRKPLTGAMLADAIAATGCPAGADWRAATTPAAPRTAS